MRLGTEVGGEYGIYLPEEHQELPLVSAPEGSSTRCRQPYEPDSACRAQEHAHLQYARADVDRPPWDPGRMTIANVTMTLITIY